MLSGHERPTQSKSNPVKIMEEREERVARGIELLMKEREEMKLLKRKFKKKEEKILMKYLELQRAHREIRDLLKEDVEQ